MATASRYDENKKIWFGPDSKFHVDKKSSFGRLVLDKLTEQSYDRVMQIDGDTDQRLTIGSRNILCRFSIEISTKDGLSHILRRLEPLIIFCDTDVLLPINKITKEIGIKTKIYSVNGIVSGYENIDFFLQPTGREEEFVCADIENAFNHAAMIACSSGSTGLPKSVIMSHALFCYTFMSRFDRFSFVSLNFSSLYWFSGMWSLVNAAFASKPRIFTARTFSPELLYKLVTDYEVELFAGPPSQLQAMLKAEFSDNFKLKTLKCCISIGGFLPTSLIRSMKEIIPNCMLLTTHGMTEIGGGTAMSMPFELDEKPSAVGRLLTGMQAKIINVTTDEKCGPDEEGEIYVKATVPFPGYFRDEKATQEAIDEDGFFRTGDLGYIDADGFLYIVGRKKEIFKNRGYSIWPDEIEDILVADSRIQAACVVSVFDSQEVTDLPAALVTRRNEASISEEQVYSLVSDKLASYKHLSGGAYFVDSLPMTPSGKVMRSKAKVIAQQFFDNRNRSAKL